MKEYRVEFTEVAKNYIFDLYTRLISDFGKKTADSVKNELEHSISNLSAMPNLGRDASELSNLLTGYRYLHLKQNTVFYTVNDSQKLVYIINIYDNRMDMLRHLLEYLGEEERKQ